MKTQEIVAKIWLVGCCVLLAATVFSLTLGGKFLGDFDLTAYCFSAFSLSFVGLLGAVATGNLDY